MQMKNIALVPIKGLTNCKRRLSDWLSQEERRELTLAMLQDVLHAVTHSNLFHEILVISPDKSVEEEGQLQNASFLQQEGFGLNAAIQQATKLALEEKVKSLTTVLADIPLIEAKDLEELFQIGREASKVVLSPSLDGGTNVMIRSPPDAISPAFGRWSYTKHLRAAQKHRFAVYSISNLRLSFDIDSVEDLRALLRLDPTGKTNAGRSLLELSVPS